MRRPIEADSQSVEGLVFSPLWICPLGFCFPPNAPVGSRKKPVEKCLLIPYPEKLQDFANQPYKS